MSETNDILNVTGASLANIDLFRELTLQDRAEIASHCRARRYQTGDRIVTHDESDSDVYFIISGTVRITFFSVSGKEVNFRDQQAGEMFGELSAIDGGGRSAHAVARNEALLAFMNQAAFTAMLESYPPVAITTLKRLATLVRLLSDRVIEFSTLGVKNRIHAELLRLAHEGTVTNNRAEISPAPNQADIASRVSTHREAVSREFRELADAGLIKRSRNRLVMLDLAALKRLVDEVSSG